MTEFLIRLHSENLAPDYQAGDVLTVTEADTAAENQLAVILTNTQGDTGIRRYNAADGHQVIGVVTAMWRTIP